MYTYDPDNEYADSDIEEPAIHITIEIIEHSEESFVRKTVIKKYNNSACLMSFDSKESLKKRISLVDNFIQVVAGNVEIIVNDIPTVLDLGQSIVIPAHSPYYLKARSCFKMISTLVHANVE